MVVRWCWSANPPPDLGQAKTVKLPNMTRADAEIAAHEALTLLAPRHAMPATTDRSVGPTGRKMIGGEHLSPKLVT